MYTTIKIQENGQVIHSSYSDGTSKVFTQCYPQSSVEFKCYESQYNGTLLETIVVSGCLFALFAIGYVVGSLRNN